MPTNLELKIRLEDLSDILDRVREINAEFRAKLNQTDVYYKYKNGLLKLRLENGSQTLIKYLRNEGSGERWSDYQLISLEKNDARGYLKDILDEETVVEKERFLYMYDNTRIHIDNVKGLGAFIELETLVLNGKTDAAERFDKIMILLALNKKSEIRKSYRDLMLEQEGR